jgi:hypothetical protein
MKKVIIFLLLISSVAYGQKNIVYHSLEVTYIGLQALDLHSTYKVLDAGGYETNPFMSKIIENKPLAIGVKVLSTGIFLGSCRVIRKDKPKIAFALLLAGNIGYGILVNHNFKLAVRLGK